MSDTSSAAAVTKVGYGRRRATTSEDKKEQRRGIRRAAAEQNASTPKQARDRVAQRRYNA